MNTTNARPSNGLPREKSTGSEVLISAALDAVADLPERHYVPEHDVSKRGLDVVRLTGAAERLGLSSIRISPEIRVFHDGERALLFYKNMSSELLYLDRAVTNRKPLTKRILARAGLPVARGSEATTDSEVRNAFAALDTLAVVKPVAGSGGRDVVTHLATADDAVAAATPILASGRQVLVEEMLTGIDVRITVVAGRTVGATLRVPANVTGDGTSSIAALVETKDALRESNDYARHQRIRLDAEKERFLAARGLRPETVPAAGQLVFLHFVANISSGGDSYEILDRLHPEIAELAVRAAAQFPSSLHAGVDLLLERFDAPLSAQRVVIGEMNLNNELPLHLYPLYGPSSPVDDVVVAEHWAQEARIPFAAWNPDDAPARVPVEMRHLTELGDSAASTEVSLPEHGVPETSEADLDAVLLHAAFTAVAEPGVDARLSPDGRLVYIQHSGTERVGEWSRRTLLAAAVGTDSTLEYRVARTSGIPVLGRHWLDTTQRERITELAQRPWRTWLVRLPQPDSTVERVRLESQADVDAAWEHLPATTRFRLVEDPTETACVLLLDGTTLLATQLLVPLRVHGDGQTSIDGLLDRELERRRSNPVLAQYAAELDPQAILTSSGVQPDAVLADGESVQLGTSPRLLDGAATVGLRSLPWPELETLAARFVTAIGNDGVCTVTFVPRQKSATEATWVLWRFFSAPSGASFRFPLRGHAYDPYPHIAQRCLSGPSRPI